MNRLPHRIRLTLGILLLLATAWPLGRAPLAGASPVLAATPQPDLQAFQRVTPEAGWVLLDQRLHWTNNGGQQWTEITPPDLGPDPIQAVNFADPRHGWLVTISLGDTPNPTYRLFRTADGGRAWASAALDLFASDDMRALAGAVYLDFLDAATGWLVVKRATSSAFNEGTLFQTTDGGDTWARLALPAGEPVHFSSAQDGWLDAGPPEPGRYVTHAGGATWERQTSLAPAAALNAEDLSDLSLATTEAGWARSAVGKCQAGACELVTQLLATGDGGQNWAPVPLPGGRAALVRTFGAPEAPGAATAAQGQSALTLTFTGHGFDSCTKPTVDQMLTWYLQSPYRVWNLYIGGSARSNCGTLTHGYVQSLAQQGWLFIPTWVGPQPPCSDRVRKMSWDPTLAYNEGIIEAYLALDVATQLGLTLPNQSGTIIYYDIENYPNDTACRAAAQAFINGWTLTLHGKGSLSGVYGGPCSSHLSDLAAIAHVPDAVWLARWQLPYAFDPNVTVWDLACVDDSLWSQGQRLRQYAGGHDENYGSVLINIDSDVSAGPLATVLGNCTPGAGKAALFVHPNFGGQCVVKNLGDYPTPASLNVPNDSTSSVRLGANVRLQLCRDDSYESVCQDFPASDVDLSNDAIGDNQVSSAKVIAYAPTLTPRAWLPLNRLSPIVTSAFPNGSFENGDSGWTTSSTRGRQPIVDTGVLAASAVTPHGGSWAAWLGNREDDDPNQAGETTTLGQIVAVPGSTPHLTYWHWIKSLEPGCYYDIASLWVNNNVVESYARCAGANTNGWVKHSVDLSAYAGSVVALRFQVDTDATLLSRLFVDDLVFQSMP